MSSFATHRQRVHDTGRSARARHAALRTCVADFAPFGFRATYHHLCHRARIPAELAADPASLVRAVEELHAARRLWLADEAAFVARRRREKAAGMRRPTPGDRWRYRADAPAYCPDPEFHPTEPLPTVVRRLLAAPVPAGGAPPRSPCPVCGTGAGTVRWHSGHFRYLLCAGCGVSRDAQPTEADRAVRAAREERWREVWRRTA
ncbi:hypothetical protein [Streptomyces lydicus]|uniref:hypothetical protein n=1 Tax=Streptomyces lydicus TaxID=47763 RepID=UPI0036EAE2D4